MGGLQDRERMLAAYGAGATVGAGDRQSESTLTETRPNELWRAAMRRLRLARQGARRRVVPLTASASTRILGPPCATSDRRGSERSREPQKRQARCPHGGAGTPVP